MIKRLVLVLLLLGLVFGGIFGWKYRQSREAAEAASQPQPPATVAVATVRTERWERYLLAVGSLVADQGLFVTNEVAGQVGAVTFESGQRVETGASLLRLDASVDRAELAGLEAEQRLAELQFRRSAELLRDRSLSRAEYDIAEAELRSTEAQVAAKRALIEKKTIRAPFAGLLGIRRVDLGEYLAPGSRIVRLESLDPIHADYALPERHFDALAPGQRVDVAVQAYPGETFEGRITAIDPGIDPGTRTLRLRATLANRDGRLRPGMFAETRTRIAEPQSVRTLPRTAVTYAPYGDSVFVVEQGEGGLTVQRRQVTTGDVREGRVEIVEGLSAGDRVVAAGQVKLRNGQGVRVDESAAPGNGTS